MSLRSVMAASACISALMLANLAPTFADGMPEPEDENYNPVPYKPGVPAPGVTQPPPIRDTSPPKSNVTAPPKSNATTPPSSASAPPPPPPPPAPPPSSTASNQTTPPPPEPEDEPVTPPPAATTPPPAATTPPPVATTPPPAATTTPPAPPVATTPPPTQPTSAPTSTGGKLVLDVVSVDVQVTPANGALVTVRGTTRTGGWTNIQLRPLQTFAPEVGMRSFTLVGTPPPSGLSTQVLSPVQATITLNPLPTDVKTIRVLSESNEVAQTFR